MDDKRPRREELMSSKDDELRSREERPPSDTRRLYIANLAERTREEDLNSAYRKFGAVKDVRVILDTFGRSKGYGFVTMERSDDGLVAQRETHNKLELDGKVLVVEIARGSLHKESGVPRRYEPYPERRRSPPPRDSRERALWPPSAKEYPYPEDYHRRGMEVRRDRPHRYDYPPFPEPAPFGYAPSRREPYRDPYPRREREERDWYPPHDYYGSSRAPWDRREWDRRVPSDYRDRDPRDRDFHREPPRDRYAMRERDSARDREPLRDPPRDARDREREPLRERESLREPPRDGRNGMHWDGRGTDQRQDTWSSKREDHQREDRDEHPRRAPRDNGKDRFDNTHNDK